MIGQTTTIPSTSNPIAGLGAIGIVAVFTIAWILYEFSKPKTKRPRKHS